MLQSDDFGPAYRDLARREPVFARLITVYSRPASAFSDGLAFLPLAALVVDYALTIAISVAAGASAVIAYVPALAPARAGLAEVLPPGVAGLTPHHAGPDALSAAGRSGIRRQYIIYSSADYPSV